MVEPSLSYSFSFSQQRQVPVTSVVAAPKNAYFSTLPLRKCVHEIRTQATVPADISDNAGTLMCNHLLYGVLHYLEEREHHVHRRINKNSDNETTRATRAKVMAGWVHLPTLPEQVCTEENILANAPSMSVETSTKGVWSIIQSCYDHYNTTYRSSVTEQHPRLTSSKHDHSAPVAMSTTMIEHDDEEICIRSRLLV